MTLNACPKCGGSVRHLGRVQDATSTSHHNNIYICGECEFEVISG